MVTIFFSLKMLNSLYIYSLGSHRFLNFIILRTLFWIFSIFCKTCVCVCPHNCHPYRRLDNKPFARFSFSFRCSYITIPKYLFSFITFIFCPLIRKIPVFLYYCFLCSKTTISVFLVLREMLFALSQ